MPHSEQATNVYLIEDLRKRLFPGAKVLDCGIGAGWSGKCVREAAEGKKVQITGLEIYLPYLIDWSKRSRLQACCHDVYDTIVAGAMGDMYVFLRDFAWPNGYDFVLFGDSLEHLREDKALETLDRARIAAQQAVYVKAPIVNYPQGPKLGNAAEEHMIQFDRARWESLGGRCLGQSASVGVFVWE